MLSIRFYHFTLPHSSSLISGQGESYASDEQMYSLLNISEQGPDKGCTLSQWKVMHMKYLWMLALKGLITAVKIDPWQVLKGVTQEQKVRELEPLHVWQVWWSLSLFILLPMQNNIVDCCSKFTSSSYGSLEKAMQIILNFSTAKIVTHLGVLLDSVKWY